MIYNTLINKGKNMLSLMIIEYSKIGLQHSCDVIGVFDNNELFKTIEIELNNGKSGEGFMKYFEELSNDTANDDLKDIQELSVIKKYIEKYEQLDE